MNKDDLEKQRKLLWDKYIDLAEEFGTSNMTPKNFAHALIEFTVKMLLDCESDTDDAWDTIHLAMKDGYDWHKDPENQLKVEAVKGNNCKRKKFSVETYDIERD